MIDHVSIAVRDLAASTAFYETVLAVIGHAKLVARPDTVGFGKSYPELWLNRRPAMATPDSGAHVCVRARSAEAVDAFYRAALDAGATSDGPPGPRPEYWPGYYAAFIRDPDGNRIETVTFLTGAR